MKPAAGNLKAAPDVAEMCALRAIRVTPASCRQHCWSNHMRVWVHAPKLLPPAIQHPIFVSWVLLKVWRKTDEGPKRNSSLAEAPERI